MSELKGRPGLSPAKQALREARLRGAARPAAIPRAPRDGALPLSFAQERFWFMDRLHPGLTAYNFPAALRFAGDVSEPAVERALGEIIRRHEVLRTAFRETGGVPAQVVAPFTDFVLPVEDLTAVEPVEREAEVRRRTAEEAARPFDLAAGPAFRARLLRLAPNDRVLLICMHHIVTDGWSMGVLYRELASLYDAFRDNRPSPLPEPPVQYADYAAWQREQLRGGSLERHLAYWKQRLAGAPELLPLATDHPRPALQSHRGALVRLDVPGGIVDRLEALARGEGATLFMVLLAAFQVLLGRHAGSEDVVVGCPTAGRTRGELEGLIGMFASTLVFRTDLGGNPSFREVLRRVRTSTLEAYEHQDVPFETLVAELELQRSLSHPPLVQVLFSLQNHVAAGDDTGRPRAQALEVEQTSVPFDLTLSLTRGPRGLAGGMQYAADLFERGTIERMLSHLVRILEQVVDDVDMRISQIELAGPEERRLVLQTWNHTARPFTRKLVHEHFAAQVRRAPDAAALVCGDAELTYAQLDAAANRLARYLVRLGVGPEARVALLLERSAQTVVAMLAVLKAGGAYVPLDPAYPPDRLAYMLADCGASVLVTQASLDGIIPVDGLHVVRLDGDGDRAVIAAEPDQVLRTPAFAENAAYVIYTSGSTGTPKGVQVTHANAAALFAGMDERVGGMVPGTWLAVSRISFDMHVVELLWTLTRGFRVVVHADVERDGTESVVRSIRAHGVTHLQCTPTLLGMIVAEHGMETLAGLERLLLGGEALPPDLAARITAVLPGGLANLYGPTETTVWSTSHEVMDGGGAIPIGRPLANARTYVLDSALQPTPVGVPGELYLGGAGVTRGYLNRRALTAERFVPDPFAPVPGARLYRTGDQALWRGDGALEFLGRLDAQVKIRGFRIEPGEVEAALRAHPTVRDCAVVAREDALGSQRLVAYVVGGADTEALRAHLRRGLPEYMVPASFVTLDALPLMPSGKLDRRALPAPETASERYVAPRTPVEVALAGIWAEALSRERVGVRDDFFALGGHSLMAMRIIARIREAFSVELPPRVLFQARTVAAVAVEVEEAAGREVPTAPIVAQARTREVLATVDTLTEEELDRLLGSLAVDAEHGT